jgi:hypothetical protein
VAITFIASEENHGVNGATTASIDTTGATILVAVVSDFTGGPGITFSDSKSNSWTALTAYSSAAGQMRVRIYYAYATAGKVGSGHTFTSAGTGVYTCACVSAFSGTDTSVDPYNADVTGQNDFATFVTAPMTTGSVTVAAGDLAIAGEGTNFGTGTTSWSIDLGFTIADQYHVSGDTEGAGLAYFINSGSSGAKNPGWTPSIASSAGAATIATFEASAGGGGDVTPSPAAGTLALTGRGTHLGFAINMPDEV